MKPTLARRLDGVGHSPTSQAAGASMSCPDGEVAIDLGAGTPDWPPPPGAIDAAHRALDASVAYGRPGGEPELLDTIVAAHHLEAGTARSAVATCGGKEAVFLAVAAVVDPGDPVVVCAPFWPTYIDVIRLCGGVSRIVPAAADGQPSLPELREACRGAKLVIVNTPGNPSGLVLTPDAAEPLAQCVRHENAWLVVDGVYGRLAYGAETIVPEWFLARCPTRTLIVDAASKRLALPGLRLGWAVGAPEWIDAVRRQQDAVSTHPSVPGQWAAQAGLRAESDWLPGIRKTLRDRAAAVVAAVAAEPRLSLHPPTGGLFALVRLPSGTDDVLLCQHLASRRGLRCVPGSAFGAPASLRLALRAPEDHLRVAVRRIAEAIAAH